MSNVSDFNRIEDCNKIDPLCIDAFSEMTLDGSILCVETSWGKQCVDLAPVVKENETCTTLYLSPEEDPNCLVYEPECGDNICIHGDDLSRIISMTKLKDVDQETAPTDGSVYIYNGTTNLFEPYDIKTVITNINTALQNINATLTNHENRIRALELKLTPPADAPSDVKVVFGNINEYSDANAVIDSGGAVTTLDKTHGLYTHLLADDVYGDEIFG